MVIGIAIAIGLYVGIYIGIAMTVCLDDFDDHQPIDWAIWGWGWLWPMLAAVSVIGEIRRRKAWKGEN